MSVTKSDAVNHISDRWRATFVACALVFASLLGLFYVTAENMVRTWYVVETYAHGFIILPLSLWLIWHKREHLAAYTPQPTPALLLPIFFGLAAWMLARLSGIQVVEQLAFVGVLIASVSTLMGWQVTKFLAFPLLFLFFAVPMGDDLVPPLMDFTADFTVSALRLTGIPVYRDGLWFSVPSGNWSVIEACSGVRYLIASVTLGVMYAYITYYSLSKRLLFIAMSAVVPIIANGIRAYMIVMIGHLSEMKYAVGVDHLIYGWIFFGIVMFLLFWIGSFWQEDDARPEIVAPPSEMSKAVVSRRIALLSGLILLSASAVVWATLQAERDDRQITDTLTPPSRSASWQKIAEPTLWNSAHPDTAIVSRGRYRSGDGEVQLFVALYPFQRQGTEAISDANKIAAEATRYEKRGSSSIALDDEQMKVNQAFAVVEAGSVNHGHLVYQWYRIAGHSLTDRYVGKAREVFARIHPGRSDGAWIAITTAYDRMHADQAEQRLQSFAKEMAPLVHDAIDDLLGLSE